MSGRYEVMVIVLDHFERGSLLDAIKYITVTGTSMQSDLDHAKLIARIISGKSLAGMSGGELDLT